MEYHEYTVKRSHSQQMIFLKELEQFMGFCPSTSDFGCPLCADLIAYQRFTAQTYTLAQKPTALPEPTAAMS